MIKVLLTAVLFSVLGWYAHAYYLEHGVPAKVTVTVAQSSAPVASPKVSKAVKTPASVKKAERVPTFDDGIDYARNHPAYTTPGIQYFPPPTI